MGVRGLLAGFLLILFLMAGLLTGLVLPRSSLGCTKKSCPCQGDEAEKVCNNCFSTNPLFFTGLINVRERCSSPKIIECENGKKADSRIDKQRRECELRLKLLGLDLFSLIKGSKQTSSDPKPGFI